MRDILIEHFQNLSSARRGVRSREAETEQQKALKNVLHAIEKLALKLDNRFDREWLSHLDEVIREPATWIMNNAAREVFREVPLEVD